jgi:hypothetical protein
MVDVLHTHKPFELVNAAQNSHDLGQAYEAFIEAAIAEFIGLAKDPSCERIIMLEVDYIHFRDTEQQRRAGRHPNVTLD